MKFLEQLRNRKAEKTQSAWERYRNLLERLCDGDEVDCDEIETIIELAGKTDEQLAADCQQLRDRRAWRNQFDECNKLKSQQSKLDLEHQQAIDEFNRIAGPLQQAINEAWNRARENNNRAIQLSGAERLLKESCFDPEIIARESRIRERMKQLSKLRFDTEVSNRELFVSFDAACARVAEWDSGRRRSFMKSLSMNAKSFEESREEAKIEELRGEIDRVRHKVETERAKLKDIDIESKRLQRELAFIDSQKVNP